MTASDARPPSDTGTTGECGAQYGRNEDLCYYPAGHKGPHTNRYGCTWAAALAGQGQP